MQKISAYWLLGAVLFAGAVQATDDWVLKADSKTDSFTLPRSVLEETLSARGASPEALVKDTKQWSALLQELFIRETLLAQQDKVKPEQMTALEKQVADYRKGQLSRLVLDALALEGVPDFSKRAEELYEARKDSQYQLPLRLRVRVLEKKLGSDAAATRTALEQLRAEIASGKLDFKDAVLAHSDAVNKKLAEGDSFWFDRTQKVGEFFDAAAALSADKPLSGVFVYQDSAYLLQFIGRQEAMRQTYPEVKEAILAELTDEYKQSQRKQILEGLRTRFQQDVEIHPGYP